MRYQAELLIHPATQNEAIRRIAASIARDAGALQFSYRVEGDIAALNLPAQAEAMRIDSLWQHSCFEAFLKADGNDSYYEFNFAPSGAWAAYRFAARRQDRESPELAAPSIACRRDAESFGMNVSLPLAAVPELAAAGAIEAGLAAVIEDARGLLSYWALAHAAREPDFHDPATFLCRLDAR